MKLNKKAAETEALNTLTGLIIACFVLVILVQVLANWYVALHGFETDRFALAAASRLAEDMKLVKTNQIAITDYVAVIEANDIFIVDGSNVGLIGNAKYKNAILLMPELGKDNNLRRVPKKVFQIGTNIDLGLGDVHYVSLHELLESNNNIVHMTYEQGKNGEADRIKITIDSNPENSQIVGAQK